MSFRSSLSREEILFNWKVFQRDSLFLQELQTRIKPRSMIELLSDQLARLSGLFSILIFDNFKYFIIILGLAATRYRTVPSKPRVPNWINNTHPKPGEFRRIFNPHRIFFLIEFLERWTLYIELPALNSYIMDSQALNSHELPYTELAYKELSHFSIAKYDRLPAANARNLRTIISLG